jgi:hypothetical protein
VDGEQRMKNVLFFPVWTVAPHFETDLELMVHEINLGNRVNILFCQKDLKICDNNLNGDKEKCNHCIRTRKKAIKMIQGDIRIIPLKKYHSYLNNHKYNIDDVASIEDMINLYYESFDIGFGIASSLAHELDTVGFQNTRNKCALFYFEAAKFYEAIKRVIRDFSIDYGYIFNGRFALPRAFFRVLEVNAIPVWTHERGATFKKYCLIENAFPHNIEKYTERVNMLWESEKNLSLKEHIANIFFKNRFEGQETEWFSFTNAQIKNKLPEEIKFYKKIVTIFNSSSFEYDYVSNEYTYEFYSSQNDGIKQIVKALENMSDIGVFLREHPNQQNRENFQRKEIRTIKANNFYLIPAESEISSYDLLLHSNMVITFNSTMGIEATYWGVPSILCSNAIYERFNIAYKPSSHEEVIDLILSDLKPIKSVDVLKIGYYSSMHGIDFNYYQPYGLFNGVFLGKNLYGDHFFIFILKRIKGKLKKIYKNIYSRIFYHYV